MSAFRSSSIDVVLGAMGETNAALTSRPIAFLQTFDWFWLHRHARTRVRPPYESIDPTIAWIEMLRTASDLVKRESPVCVTIQVATDGMTVFGFAPYSRKNVD
jgi:hypothetical protein